MKLLARTTRYYSLAFATVLLVHALISYFSINYFVHRRLERALLREKRIVEREIKTRDNIPAFPGFGENEFSIRQVPSSEMKADEFRTVFIGEEEERQEYYQLQSFLSHKENTYQLNFRKSLVQTNELILSLLLSSVLAIGLLLAGLVYVNRKMNRKIWDPFYQTLRQLAAFELRSGKKQVFSESEIKEFDALNRELNVLTQKIHQDYQGQKHFVENASHELQTPLAVIKTQLELLLQSDQLTREDVQLVASALNAADRLTKINKSLITLSRIENLQYAEKSEVSLRKVVDQNMSLFRLEAKARNLKIHYEAYENATLYMSEPLAHMIVRNLIQNAIRHNIDGGEVWIYLTDRVFGIKNTGKPLLVGPDKLFERFYKKSDTEGSIGLGLPIVKQICERYDFKITYRYTEPHHFVQIFFVKEG